MVTSRLRARQTAQASGLDSLPVTVDDRWTELDFGAYDERRGSEVLGELMAAWAADASYAPPGGESMASLHERVGEAVAEILDEALTRDIVVISHATPIKSAVARLLGGGPEVILRLWLRPASVTVADISDYGPVLSEFNWCPARHLR